jgi:hypothetical protein
MTPDNGQRLAHRIVSLHCGVSPAIEGHSGRGQPSQQRFYEFTA